MARSFIQILIRYIYRRCIRVEGDLCMRWIRLLTGSGCSQIIRRIAAAIDRVGRRRDRWSV
jgi:hypothetical protein